MSDEQPEHAEVRQHPATVAAELETVSRRARWMGPVFAALALVMIPWTVHLSLTLPRRVTATHYDLAWGGFDIGLVLALGWTAYSAFRGTRWLPIAASVNASMLVVDAWFDVVTAPHRGDRLVALVLAMLVEIPLSAVCVWLAINGQQIIERRLTLRL